MEHQILRSDYAGISVDENAVATTITLANSWFMVTVFGSNAPSNNSTPDQANNRIIAGASGDYMGAFDTTMSTGANKVVEKNVFEVSATEFTITSATKADPVVVTTSAAHGLSNGDKVKISGSDMTEINDRIFTIQDKGATTFELTDDGGASPANDIDGSGFVGAGTTGTVQAVTETDLHSHRHYVTNAAIGYDGQVPYPLAVTRGNALELAVKNVTDTTDVTAEHASMSIQRVG